MLARIKRNSTTGNLEIQRLSGMSPDSVPIGVIFPLYSNTVPTGFLPCNGVQFDAEQYSSLYNLLGTNVLPDLRECTLVGIGENTTDTLTTHDIYTLGQFKDCQSTPTSAGPTVTGNNLVLNNDTTLGASNRYVVHQYTSNPVDPVTGVTRARSKGVNFIIKAITGNITSDIENALNAKVDKTLTNPITIDETTYNTVIAALEAMAAKINSGLEAIQYVQTLPVSPDIHNVIYAIMGTSKYKYYAGDEDNQTLQELGGSGSTFIGKQAEWDALTSAEQLEYDVADITDAPGDGTVVVDAIEDGNLNAVSSNAIYDALATRASTITIDTSVYNVNAWFTLRKCGNVVTLTGRCWKEEQMVTPDMTVIGHVPEGFRPMTDTYFTCHMFDANKTQFLLYINPVGDIMTAGAGATSSRIDFYVNMSWII